MIHYKYLIVGGGMSAAAAVEGIRSQDKTGSIGLISAEAVGPYDRPPLSKGLWHGKTPDQIQRRLDDYKVRLHLERMVRTLNPAEKLVQDDHERYAYDKLLLATGGTPRRLPEAPDDIIYYRTFEDYQRLRSYTKCDLTFAVVGGGFIGAEITAALAQNDEHVTMIFPESGIGANRFPASLAAFLNDYYQARGVRVMAGQKVTALAKQGQQIHLHLDSGEALTVDVVVAGLGISPNVELAQQAGLELSDGIVVDDYLQTSQTDIFAAGDVASFYNPALNKRLRVEHADNANAMGYCAGQNMAGAANPYTYLPYFYSDLFDLGYEAVGETSSRLQTVADWEEPNRKGIVYYLRNEYVRGVLLWNVWDTVKAATRLITEHAPFRKDAASASLHH